MKKLILLVTLFMSGCAVDTTTNTFTTPTLVEIRRDNTISWNNYTRVLKSIRTGKCYIGVYEVGLVEAPNAECAP